MITTAVVGAACLALGLYSGKKRARGEKWAEIAEDLRKDTCHTLRTACDKVSRPFRLDVEEPFKEDPK